MLESIINFLISLEENETVAPIITFIFKWTWMGPMYIVDNFVLPIVDVIGEMGFVALMVAIICVIVGFWLRPRKNPAEESPIDELTPDSYYIRDDF